MANPFKKNEIYGFQTLYREIGYYISRLEHYERSLKFFDEAIKKTPDDKRALLGRSKARAKVIEYEGALEDVRKALNLDPEDLVLLAEKALNTYLCCEFEEGLIQNSRLLPKRQKPENFHMGVMHCSDAIENCLGIRAGRPLRDHFKIIRKLAWKRNYAAQKPYEPKPRNKPAKKKQYMSQRLQTNEIGMEPVQPQYLKHKKSKSVVEVQDDALQIKDSLHSAIPDDEPIPRFEKPFPYRPLQRHTTNIENYMAEKYLDSMYLDKIFLKKIPETPGATCPNTGGSKKIREVAKHCFKSVAYRQELLRTRRPFYFIKYQEGKLTGALKLRMQMELEHQQQCTKQEAEHILNKMNEAYEDRDVRNFLHLLEKLKSFCDTKPKKLLPDKEVFMAEIYDKVCKVFYDTYRLNPSHNLIEQNKRVYGLLGLPMSRNPSRDSVIVHFKDVFVDFNKQIKLFEDRLREAEVPEEVCWYYHELSRYHIEQKHFDLARVYARKCIQEAHSIKNDRWIFNCTMLITKSNLMQNNKNDARNNLNSALTCAESLQDQDKIEFIRKCLEVSESVEIDDVLGQKVLEKRQNKIIQMMSSSKMKDEVAHLFRQMDAMPACRRMTVMPGVRAEDRSDKKNKSRVMSIIPPERGGNAPAPPEIMKPAKKRDETGAEFMNLVEFHL